MSGWSAPGLAVWGGRPVARRCGDLAPRRRAVLRGALSDVRVRWFAGGVATEAVLSDGTGDVMLRWLGRDTVAGVTVGRTLVVEGTALAALGRLVLLNPLVALVEPQHLTLVSPAPPSARSGSRS